MPTALLSLFLIFTVTILTGMCAIFPKKDITVYDDEEKIGTIHMNSKNLKEALNNYLFYKKRGKLKDNDLYSLKELGNKKFEARINRGFDIKAQVFGKNQNVNAKAGDSVLDVLKSLGINEMTNLEISPEVGAKVTPQTELKIIKINQKKEQEQQVKIPYGVKVIKNKNLHKNERVVQQKGVEGCKHVYCLKTYDESNGNLIREEKKEDILKQPQEEIVQVGVKEIKDKNHNVKVDIANSKTSTKKLNKDSKKAVNKQNGKKPAAEQKPVLGPIPKEYSKVYHGTATAYVAKGRTARMGPARVGVVAANPKVFPYGTKLYVEKYGHCVVGDKCGAACRGSSVIVDVCFKTEKECRAWGRRKVNVYVIKN